jgi:hypothetical protein
MRRLPQDKTRPLMQIHHETRQGDKHDPVFRIRIEESHDPIRNVILFAHH